MVISPNPYMPTFIQKKKYYPPSHNYIIPYEGIDVVRPPYFKLPVNFLRVLSHKNLSKVILRSFNGHNPRLIHAHFGPCGAAALPLKRKLNAPLITSFYGFDSGRFGEKFKSIYMDLSVEGDRFLVLSEDMRHDLLKLGFPDYKISIHRLGVNTDKFKKIKTSNDFFIFLIVAAFQEKKGIQHAIYAFSKLYQTRKDIELIIMGMGPFEKQINYLINKLNLNSSVKIINNVKSVNPRALVLEYMGKCDAFVLTSFTTRHGQKEGTPVVLMEAQSCSKPCISTFHAGIPEVVIDGETGFLVKEKDIDGIADKMRLLVENKRLLERLGANARKHVKRNYNHEKQMDKLVDVYRKVIVD